MDEENVMITRLKCHRVLTKRYHPADPVRIGNMIRIINTSCYYFSTAVSPNVALDRARTVSGNLPKRAQQEILQPEQPGPGLGLAGSAATILDDRFPRGPVESSWRRPTRGRERISDEEEFLQEFPQGLPHRRKRCQQACAGARIEAVLVMK